MNCPICNGIPKKFGKNQRGQQRYHCNVCQHSFIEHPKQFRIDRDKALLCLNLLVEGTSIRSAERITSIHRDTILRLVNHIGTRCQNVMDEHIKDINVGLIEADELWGFVKKKEGNKRQEEKSDDTIGNAWTFVAIEATTKLIVCYHLGKRDKESATTFMQKLQRASNGRFQLTTDGLPAYKDAVDTVFGADIDYAQLVKKYKSDETGNIERRYSPGDFVSATKTTVNGNPTPFLVSTSYVERNNLTIRMSMRRLTRLTNGFSKKWENLDMALALHFAYYNFCRVHLSLRVTPCMEAGITNHIWTMSELIGELP